MLKCRELQMGTCGIGQFSLVLKTVCGIRPYIKIVPTNVAVIIPYPARNIELAKAFFGEDERAGIKQVIIGYREICSCLAAVSLVHTVNAYGTFYAGK